MIWFIVIAVVVIIFYAIVSRGTSIKSVEDEYDNDEEEAIPLSITVTTINDKLQEGIKGSNMDSQMLKQNGFEGFVTIGKLKSDPNQIPTKQGVYAVLLPENGKPAFLETGTGGFFKDKNPNVPIAELEANWVDNTDIIYIGKAGGSSSKATLQSRLIQYLKFGMGMKIGHWGGRYIWQLANSDSLIICWKPTKQDARDVESEMIEQFKREHNGCRPFANLKD